MRPLRPTVLGLVALLVSGAFRLGAQAVAGLGDDALTLPGGMVRVSVRGDWTTSNERYGSGTPSRANGSLEPLGVDFTTDSLGAAQLPLLLPLQTGLRTLTGISTLNVSLGKVLVSASDRIQTIPLAAEIGISRFLKLGVTVPIVKTRANVFMRANPKGNEGNVAFNPALSSTATFVADTAFANQMVRAAAAAQSYCSGAGASTAQCAGGVTMATNAQSFGTTLGQIYGGALFVPTRQSNVQSTIDTRAANFKNALNAIAAVSGSGVPAITASGVVAAQTPLTAPDVQQILHDPTYGIAADSLATIERTHLGDITAEAKLLLFDPFHGNTAAQLSPKGIHGRLAVGVAYRFPTGETDTPTNLMDVGTGTHEAAVSGRGYFDLLVGPQFWASVVGRYTHSLGSDRTVRVTDTPSQVYAPSYRQMAVHQQLGNLLEVEITPRWVFNNFVSASLQYVHRHQAATTYTGTMTSVGPSAATGGTTVSIDPRTLNAETEFTEQRVGGGFAFSNLAAVQKGQARIPFEVSWIHYQTVKGSGGNVPKLFGELIQLRLYTRLLGK